MISRPGHREPRRRQRGTLPAWFPLGRARRLLRFTGGNFRFWLASRALPPPFHRNHRPPLPPAPAAPEPPFEIEYLGRGAQSAPQQGLRRQQRDMLAGGAIDLDEIARPEILDPRR